MYQKVQVSGSLMACLAGCCKKEQEKNRRFTNTCVETAMPPFTLPLKPMQSLAWREAQKQSMGEVKIIELQGW